MKRVVRASEFPARLGITRLRKYAVSDGQIVDTLCAKLIDHMDEEPNMTFEDGYYYLTAVDWEDDLYPRVKERLKDLGIWVKDEDTLRDVFY